jgi:hypothetical protein
MADFLFAHTLALPTMTTNPTESLVYEVLRRLYSVPSSPLALHKPLDGYFKSLGFTNVGFEESVWNHLANETR